MSYRWLLALGVAFSLFVACARESPPPKAPGSMPAEPSSPPSSSSGPYQVGVASYYANSLAGRKTANGERYDPKKMTAAHRGLPFGTVVEVRAKKSGRKVVVKINDRGPFGKRTRIIDLSRAAAEELNMIRAGVIDVELRILSWPPPRQRR